MRIRTVKPEFWRSTDISSMPRELRLLFIGLWSYVDDNGVGVDDHRQIAADLFPLDDDPVESREFVREGLATLSRGLLIERYEAGGKPYLFIRTWDRHQKVDKPNKPRHPRPTGVSSENATGAGSSRERREELAPVTEEQGNRGTGEDPRATTHDESDEESSAGGSEAELELALPTSAMSTKPTPSKSRGGNRASPRDSSPLMFEEFWEAWPRKTAKTEARKKFAAAIARGAEPARIVESAKAHAEQWRRENKEVQYIPHATTWLNQGRYEDAVERADLRLVSGADSPWGTWTGPESPWAQGWG